MSDLSPTAEHHRALFRVRLSIRYHSRRQAHYDRCHRAVVFLALVMSSASVLLLTVHMGGKQIEWVLYVFPALVSLVTSADLVVGFVQKARLHTDLLRQFTDLERKLVGPEGEKQGTIDAVLDTALLLEVGEPPVLQVLATLCHNELVKAMGFPKEEEIKVNWLQRMLAQLFDFRAQQLRADPKPI